MTSLGEFLELGPVRWWRKQKRARKLRRLGRELPDRIAETDFVLVSFPKSGRTWLRALISELYQRRYDLPAGMLIDGENMHALRPEVPKVLITHDCDPIGPVSAFDRDKSIYAGRKVILLIRHPCDAAVSHFFFMKHRRREDRADVVRDLDVYRFLMRPGYGLELVIEYLNTWCRYAKGNGDVLVLRYEELRAHPLEQMRRVAVFLGGPFDDAELQAAIDACSFNSLRRREGEGHYEGTALMARDRSDPNAFKVRRGKVAGFVDYFDAGQLAMLQKVVRERLDPEIGYSVEFASDHRMTAG